MSKIIECMIKTKFRIDLGRNVVSFAIFETIAIFTILLKLFNLRIVYIIPLTLIAIVGFFIIGHYYIRLMWRQEAEYAARMNPFNRGIEDRIKNIEEKLK